MNGSGIIAWFGCDRKNGFGSLVPSLRQSSIYDNKFCAVSIDRVYIDCTTKMGRLGTELYTTFLSGLANI